MVLYESSYEAGRKPYRPDVDRGFWAHPNDFMWACMGMSLKTDILSLSSLFFDHHETLLPSIIANFFCAYLYVMPLMVLQAFMGQFSSSGFISSFRIAPLFKGIGYICLVLNIVVLFYYTLLATVPLFFFLNSLRPTLPWSCEAAEYWFQNHTKQDNIGASINIKYSQNQICNITTQEDINKQEFENVTTFVIELIPSVQYFRQHFNNLLFTYEDPQKASISFQMLACILMVWGIIAAIFYFSRKIGNLGIFLRYAVWTSCGLLLICLLRFSFLPGAWNAWHKTISIQIVPLLVMNCFGGGWGTITALASHNNFNYDIIKYSWFIIAGQLFITLGLSLVLSLTEAHFRHITDADHVESLPKTWALFISTASAIANMPLPNLWSLLFYATLTLGGIILILTQLISILTTLFDEFEELRVRKQEVTFGILGIFALSSLYFCTNYGIAHFSALSADVLFTQTALSLLLIFVMLWVYGRERFQRDIEFMLNKSLGNVRIFLLRFIAPFCLLFVLFLASCLAIREHIFGSTYFVTTTMIHTVLPWMFLPGYATYLLVQNSGTFIKRLKRACRPNDWYPMDAEQRQKYEETMNNKEITHQLTEVTEEAHF